MKQLLLALALAASMHAASVTLGWTASTTPGIAGNNVYRASCVGGLVNGACANPGPYVKIGSVHATTTNYIDNSVTALRAYSYYATSFCPATGCDSGKVFGESIPSNSVAVLAGVSVAIAPPGNLNAITK